MARYCAGLKKLHWRLRLRLVENEVFVLYQRRAIMDCADCCHQELRRYLRACCIVIYYGAMAPIFIIVMVSTSGAAFGYFLLRNIPAFGPCLALYGELIMYLCLEVVDSLVCGRLRRAIRRGRVQWHFEQRNMRRVLTLEPPLKWPDSVEEI